MNRSCVLSSTLVLALLGLTACGEKTAPEKPVDTTADTTAAASKASAKPSSAPIALIELSNPDNAPRQDVPYYVSFADLGLTAEQAIAAKLGATFAGNPVATDIIDQDGDGQKDGVFTLLNFSPAQVETLTIDKSLTDKAPDTIKRTQAEISQKTGGAWQEDPEKPGKQIYVGGQFENVTTLTPPAQHTDHSYFIRYEGPGIESDLVGYRVYLDWRNGFDIFGKKTHDMTLQDVGQDGFDSYHEPADWGMDILKVGSAVGAGGYGYWDGEKVVRVSDVEGWDATILDNGSLYSSFSILYKNWKVADKQLKLTAQLSMTGGSRLVHTHLTLNDDLDNLAAGIVKHPGTELITGDMNITGDAYSYIASWGKQTLNDDHLGMAVLFRKRDLDQQTQDEHNYVAVLKPADKDLDYYFLAAWEGETDGIKTRDEFVAYLDAEVKKLNVPVRERIKTAFSQADKSFPVSAAAALEWSKRLADSELERKALGYHVNGWDVNRERDPKFEYDIIGLLPMAYDELNEESKDPRYAEVIEKVTGSFIAEDGTISRYTQDSYNIDSVFPGVSVLRLYEKTGENKYKVAVDTLRQQLHGQPRTSEGAFWHKKKYDWQLWLDGVYMGMPFLAHYSQLFEDGASLDEVIKEFEITRKQLRDPETGLYYHAWDEKKQQDWANPATGLSPEFWARGLGWLSMALVDTLDFIPAEDTTHREPLINMIKEIAATLATYQDSATGTWWQVMDKPDTAGNYRESSATAMFTYFYAKALNKGYLDQQYLNTAQKAYDGLIREFVLVHPDNTISLTNICYVAGLGFGRNGSYQYYMSERVYENDPKGTGPFILAGIEMNRLLAQ